MNSSIIDIVSQALSLEQGPGGPANLLRTNTDTPLALSEFERTLQALLLSGEHADGIQQDKVLGLSRAQLDSLVTLAEASPDEVASLLEAESAQSPETAAVAIPSLVLGQSGTSAWPGATAVPSGTADANLAGATAGITTSVPDTGKSALPIPSRPAPALETSGMPDGALAEAKEPALAADKKLALTAEKNPRGVMQERGTLRQADATAMPSHVTDNVASLPRGPSSEHAEAFIARESVAPRAEIAPLISSFSPTSSALAAPAANPAALPVAQMQAAIGSAQWSGELGEQVVAFTLRGDQQVALHLNPRELGPLLVELVMVNNQAHLQFVSSQQPVRAAVEAALPELRNHFEQQGIALGDASVSDESQRQHDQRMTEETRDSMSHGELSATGDVDPNPPADPPQTTAAGQISGRVNLYI